MYENIFLNLKSPGLFESKLLQFVCGSYIARGKRELILINKKIKKKYCIIIPLHRRMFRNDHIILVHHGNIQGVTMYLCTSVNASTSRNQDPDDNLTDEFLNLGG